MDDCMQRLKTIAFQKTDPFCYGCYQFAPTGRCPICGSDDLMRHLNGVGVEYGTDWVIRHLVAESLTPVDEDAAFEESVSQLYPEEVTIGWITVDTARAIRELDPVSWDLARSEWIDAEVSDGNLLTFDHGGAYFWQSDVQHFVEEAENELEAAG